MINPVELLDVSTRLIRGMRDDEAIALIGGGIGGCFGLCIGVIIVASLWRIFTKAGQPGWAAIVPIYNIFVLTQICNKPPYWIVFFFIPFVNFVAGILMANALARSFGKGAGFTVGMILLPMVFYPLLAMDNEPYRRVD